jgi:hypothetical protein
MKRIFTAFVTVLITGSILAQIPEKMSYQAVIRNSSDQLVSNTQVGMQISILQGSANGTSVYAETQYPTTNANGLISVEIGGGTGWAAIDWSSDIFFIKTETDPAGGTNYTIVGTSQLLSVPYALHAKTVEKDEVDDADADPTNELQSLSINGDQITLSEGGGVISVDTSYWQLNGDNLYYNRGNIGIGTGSPSAGLHLYKNIDNSLILKIQNANAGSNASERLYFGTSSNDAGMTMFGNGSSNAGKLRFFNNRPAASMDFVIGGNIRLSMLNNGYIGVGVTNPSEKLEVNGSIKVAQSIKYSDGTSQASTKMMPIAVGTISSTGSILGGSGNISCTHPLTGRYDVHVSGVTTFGYTTHGFQITPSSAQYAASADPSGNTIIVILRNDAGTAADAGFYITVFEY